jgi:hypothetical protein
MPYGQQHSPLVFPSTSWGPAGQPLPTLAGAVQCLATARSTSTSGSAWATGPLSLTTPGHPIRYLLVQYGWTPCIVWVYYVTVPTAAVTGRWLPS